MRCAHAGDESSDDHGDSAPQGLLAVIEPAAPIAMVQINFRQFDSELTKGVSATRIAPPTPQSTKIILSGLQRLCQGALTLEQLKIC